MSDISSQPFTEKLFRLDGRVTLITGASRGIGYGVALGFATLGCRAVVITSRHKEEIEASANSIRAALEETHPSNSCQIVPLQQDVSDDSSNKRVVDNIITQFGHLDILVNNAALGVSENVPATKFSMDAFRKQLHVNVAGVFHLSRTAYPHLKQSKFGPGRVINISSIASKWIKPGRGAYDASKIALNHLSSILAREWGPHVTVNAVGPGPVMTELLKKAWRPDQVKEMERTMPMRRIGTPEDILAAVAYFASSAGAYATGQVIFIDGGISLL